MNKLTISIFIILVIIILGYYYLKKSENFEGNLYIYPSKSNSKNLIIDQATTQTSKSPLKYENFDIDYYLRLIKDKQGLASYEIKNLYLANFLQNMNTEISQNKLIKPELTIMDNGIMSLNDQIINNNKILNLKRLYPTMGQVRKEYPIFNNNKKIMNPQFPEVLQSDEYRKTWQNINLQKIKEISL